MRTFLNLFKPIQIDSEPNKNLFNVLRKNVDLLLLEEEEDLLLLEEEDLLLLEEEDLLLLEEEDFLSSSSRRRRSSSSRGRRSWRRRSSSSRRRRSYNAGSKRFSQVQHCSKRFNVCASSNRTDGPPRTPLKGSPPLKRFGSGSGSTDSPVRYEPPRFLLLLETCLSGFSGSCCHLTCESPLWAICTPLQDSHEHVFSELAFALASHLHSQAQTPQARMRRLFVNRSNRVQHVKNGKPRIQETLHKTGRRLMFMGFW